MACVVASSASSSIVALQGLPLLPRASRPQRLSRRASCSQPAKLSRRAAAPLRVAMDGEAETSGKDSEKTSTLNQGKSLDEQFAVIDSGMWECQACSYVYTEKDGDPEFPVAKGTSWKNLPEDWYCPTCGGPKNMFRSKSKQVAGFSQNQGYGLGGNTLTEGQKSILIYGSLLFFFALFIAGYNLE